MILLFGSIGIALFVCGPLIICAQQSHNTVLTIVDGANGRLQYDGISPLPSLAAGPPIQPPPGGGPDPRCSATDLGLCEAGWTTFRTGNVAVAHTSATDVNGNYDIKASFGATGSQQTVTCIATANSNTLTHCSGGDFVVGSTIHISQAGYAPTVSAPTAIRPICNAYNGASCKGSVTYCYRISYIQGIAITAASPPGCITQAAQTYPPFNGVGAPPVPAVTTSLALPTATNVSGAIVWKSINREPYSFMVNWNASTNLTDTGHWQAVDFTCEDTGLPCAPPSSAVPSDIFAQITGINGDKITIAADANQPQMWLGNSYGLPSKYYPSTPTVSGAVTVQHDDSPAFYKASVALMQKSNGSPLALHIPAGNYNVWGGSDPYGKSAVMHLNRISNLTIAGDGDASKLWFHGGGVMFDAVCGFGNNNPAGNCTNFGHLGGNAPGYPLNDPVVEGATIVTLTNPPDSTKFRVGGYVTIYTNTPLTYPGDMYGELNYVTAINSRTGQITLAYATTKYYSASLVWPYRNCTVCAAQPYLSPVTPNGAPVTKNITLRDFWFRGLGIFDDYNVSDFWTEKNLTIFSPQKVVGGVGRHHYIYNERLTEDGFNQNNTSFEAAAAGSTDYIIQNSVYTAPHFLMSGQPCSEGSANIKWTNNTFNLSGFGDYGRNYNGVFMGSAQCYNFEFIDNEVHVSNTWLYSVLGSGTGPPGSATAKYSHNRFYIARSNAAGTNSVAMFLTPQMLKSATDIVDATNTWTYIGTTSPTISKPKTVVGNDVTVPR